MGIGLGGDLGFASRGKGRGPGGDDLGGAGDGFLSLCGDEV